MHTRQPISYYRDGARLAYRRDLPHLVLENAIYFVTARLQDSIPRERLIHWNNEVNRWKELNPPPHSPDQIEAFANLGYRRMERWLDRCEGASTLADQRAQQIVRDCLEKRDGIDYLLGDYAVMPNHVHVLVRILPPATLKKVVDVWLRVTTHRINELIGRNGTLWQLEPFDHIARNEQSLRRMRQYIQENGRWLAPERWCHGVGGLFQD